MRRPHRGGQHRARPVAHLREHGLPDQGEEARPWPQDCDQGEHGEEDHCGQKDHGDQKDDRQKDDGQEVDYQKDRCRQVVARSKHHLKQKRARISKSSLVFYPAVRDVPNCRLWGAQLITSPRRGRRRGSGPQSPDGICCRWCPLRCRAPAAPRSRPCGWRGWSTQG